MKKLATLTLMAAMVTPAFAEQPKMDATLRNLNQAKAALLKARPNKGGHRRAALNLIDKAIEEVKAGMEHARKNRK